MDPIVEPVPEDHTRTVPVGFTSQSAQTSVVTTDEEDKEPHPLHRILDRKAWAFHPLSVTDEWMRAASDRIIALEEKVGGTEPRETLYPAPHVLQAPQTQTHIPERIVPQSMGDDYHE
jgi:hypothetical protein